MNIKVHGTQKVIAGNHKIVISGELDVSIQEVIEEIQEVIEMQIIRNTITKKDQLEISGRNVYGYDWYPHSGYYNKQDVRQLTADEWSVMNSVLNLKNHFQEKTPTP